MIHLTRETLVRNPEADDHGPGCGWFYWDRCDCGKGIVRDVGQRFARTLSEIMKEHRAK